MNFIMPGVPDSENQRFLSYTACKNGIFTVFSTVFEYWKSYSPLASSNSVPTSKLLIHRLNITLRCHGGRYWHAILDKTYYQGMVSQIRQLCVTFPEEDACNLPPILPGLTACLQHRPMWTYDSAQVIWGHWKRSKLFSHKHETFQDVL